MTIRTLTQSDLADEARARFGDDPRDWAFQCPSCKDIASGSDFTQALKERPLSTQDGDPITASTVLGQHCIGRHLGALDTPTTHTRGCDWSAYGLIPGPWTILMPDGKEVPAFPLAPAPEEG